MGHASEASHANKKEAPVWHVDGPLVLSDPRLTFPGCVDGLVVSALAAGEAAKLPESVHFAAGTPAEIHFGPDGGLDRAFHPGPIQLVLEYDDGARETIAVGIYGTVE